MYKTKKSVVIGLLVAQALVLSIIESWFPLNLAVPGIKPGFANIVTLITLSFFGLKEAMLVVVIRCFLSSIFSGNIIFLAFSLTGGILSTLLMWLLLKYLSKLFSIIGVSMVGAIAHNLGQLIIAMIVFSDLAILYYLPVLIVSGLIMGFIIGYCSKSLIGFLKKSKLLDSISSQ